MLSTHAATHYQLAIQKFLQHGRGNEHRFAEHDARIEEVVMENIQHVGSTAAFLVQHGVVILYPDNEGTVRPITGLTYDTDVGHYSALFPHPEGYDQVPIYDFGALTMTHRTPPTSTQSPS